MLYKFRIRFKNAGFYGFGFGLLGLDAIRDRDGFEIIILLLGRHFVARQQCNDLTHDIFNKKEYTLLAERKINFNLLPKLL